MLLGPLGAFLLGDLLTKNLSGKGTISTGEGVIRAGYGSKRSSLKKFLDPATKSSPRESTASFNKL